MSVRENRLHYSPQIITINTGFGFECSNHRLADVSQCDTNPILGPCHDTAQYVHVSLSTKKVIPHSWNG